MGVLDDIFADDAANFTDPELFGEQVIYKPRDGASRPINAIVDRQPPERMTPDGEVFMPKIEIEVANNSTSGISAAEMNNGGDKVTVALRKGGIVKDFLIRGEPIQQDAGMIRLSLS